MFNEVSYSKNRGGGRIVTDPYPYSGAGKRYSTGLGDLGNAPNYVFAGARIYWAGTVSSVPSHSIINYWRPGGWASALAAFQSGVQSEFPGARFESNEDSKSIAVNVTAPIDFADLHDVQALIDGIAGSSGFGLAASMARFISNPRTDQGTTPNIGGGNLSSGGGSGKDPFSTAADFWGSEISTTVNSFWGGLTGQGEGEGGGMNMLVIAALAIGAIFILKR